MVAKAAKHRDQTTSQSRTLQLFESFQELKDFRAPFVAPGTCKVQAGVQGHSNHDTCDLQTFKFSLSKTNSVTSPHHPRIPMPSPNRCRSLALLALVSLASRATLALEALALPRWPALPVQTPEMDDRITVVSGLQTDLLIWGPNTPSNL